MSNRLRIELNVDELAITLMEAMGGNIKPPNMAPAQVLDRMGEEGEVARNMARSACDYFKRAMGEGRAIQ